MWHMQFVILITASLFSISTGARILGIFPVQSKSHHSLNQVIFEELSRHHQVTVLSYFSDRANNPNYTSINLNPHPDIPSYIDSVSVEKAKELSGFWNYMNWFVDSLEINMCDTILSHDYIQDVINSKTKRPDLIIAEMYQIPHSALIAEKLDIPIITLLPPTSMTSVDWSIGNPVYPAYLPGVLNGYTQHMNFKQRLVNTVEHITLYILQCTIIEKRTLDLARKYVGNEGISLQKLYQRIAFGFYNTHYAFINRPNSPNAIDIGGIHVKPAKPLPQDMEKFIEESKDGVIYVSFGTTFKLSSLGPEKLNVFKNAFAKMPQKILWRSDVTNITDIPSNVKLGKWFPQRDILEHKNVRAFISHGGIFGTFEAIHTGTPTICIPFLFDQFSNCYIMQEKEVGIQLDYDTVTSKSLYDALQRIINDKKYYENMNRLSSEFNDRPMSPLDTAVYWIEYTLRHKGASHMRVTAADMPMYQYLLLDVIAFILLVISAISFLVYFVCKILVSKIMKSILSDTAKKNQ